MIVINTNGSIDFIKKNFDYMTSEAYYAGSDDFLDVVFTGHRTKNRLFLIHKPPKIRSTFTTVFRGKIVATEDGCKITGRLTKRIADYILFFIVTAMILFFSKEIMKISYNTGLVLALVWGAVMLYFLFPTPNVKRKYEDFLKRIIKGY
ncbi:MAG: hypothetical protein A2Y17_01800 [Clostridiales bacterium GWF2_38_85]|nr:MAG: hypothetical protein A2Y17_01800 [Clostridiales bacterium GWF2_38_85]HBL84756.1 hypothetical protein [Clostridiales bacterium]